MVTWDINSKGNEVIQPSFNLETLTLWQSKNGYQIKQETLEIEKIQKKTINIKPIRRQWTLVNHMISKKKISNPPGDSGDGE